MKTSIWRLVLYCAAIVVNPAGATAEPSALRVDPCPDSLYFVVDLTTAAGEMPDVVSWNSVAPSSRVWAIEVQALDEIDAQLLENTPALSVSRDAGDGSAISWPEGSGTHGGRFYLVVEHVGGTGCSFGIEHTTLSGGKPSWIGLPGEWYGIGSNIDADVAASVHAGVGGFGGVGLSRAVTSNEATDSTPENTPLTVSANASPNPFNPSTEIRYTQVKSGVTKIQVFSANGRLVWESENRHAVPGTYSVAWNGVDMGDKPVASGVYLVSVKLPTQQLNMRVVLLK